MTVTNGKMMSLAFLAGLLMDVTSQDIPTPTCLGCLCEAISECDSISNCVGEVCGPFRLTLGFWIDAGKPTIPEKSNNDALDYKNCAIDFNCATYAVKKYMQRYQKDCNGDGNIDCDDFVAILGIGPFGCNSTLPELYAKRYEECKEGVLKKN